MGSGVSPRSTTGSGLFGRGLMVALWALAAFVLPACSSREVPFGPTPDLPLQEIPDSGPTGLLPDSAFNNMGLRINRLAPDHGPFVGGNEVIVRGGGFAEGAVVTVGGHMVQPADTILVDDRRLSIVVPAGEVGPADVTVTVGGETTTLPDGYTYERIYVTPSRGSVAGGTLITITGSETDFSVTDTVLVGNVPCRDVMVISPTQITCRTPAANADDVDITVRDAGLVELTAKDGFTYYDGTDTVYGGLGGGPIEGNLTVTVVDAFMGLPVPDAFVVVGEDFGTPYQGLTDIRGQVAFSGNDLVGPVTVHVAKKCFEKTTFVSFDAADVTVFLVPWLDPSCAPPSPGGGGGGGAGRNGAFISGDLVWPLAPDRPETEWNFVPLPKDNERRIAYVFTTQESVESANPAPGPGGVVVEAPNGGPNRYAYTIFARPGALAVYALAGIENKSTRKFVPYSMGIARNVLAGPGESVQDVDLDMTIPLDRSLSVALSGVPNPATFGPDHFRGKLHMDLGGEGVLVREVNGGFYDEVQADTATAPFKFLDLPPSQGLLHDARYWLSMGWFTGSSETQPLTVVVQTGVKLQAKPLEMNGMLGIPVATSPATGDTLPADRILRWDNTGGVEADFHIILITGADGNPAWRHVVPGNVFEAPIPDFSSIPNIPDVTSGFVSWVIYAVKAPGLDYNEFTYRYFQQDTWSHFALDSFTAVQN